MNLILILLMSHLTFAQKKSADEIYAEKITLSCMGNLSALYQDRMELLQEIDKGQAAVQAQFQKMGLKRTKDFKGDVPFVLSQKLDLEHLKGLKENEKNFSDWEARFFLKEALPFLKACITHTQEVQMKCMKAKNLEACKEKEMPQMSKAMESHSPYLKFMNSMK